MSFSNQEQSTEGGAPIEIYDFTGADTFRFTSASQPYTDSEGNVYEPVAMSRTAPTVTLKESSGSISLKMPFNNPFASRYLGGVPPSPDRVIIRQVHLSDLTREEFPFWSGSVSGVKFSGTEATVGLSGIMSRTGSQIPAQTFSWMCDHDLYDGLCRVSRSENTYDFTVASVSADGITVTLTDEGQAATPLTGDASFFNGGLFLTGVDGSQRMGINFEATANPNEYTLVLLVPIDGLEAGQSITFTAGCDKSIGTCRLRFNNTRNYGGFPFVPTINPHEADNRLTKSR